MKSKERFNETFVYDSTSVNREASEVEPRFGSFLTSTSGTGSRVLDVGCGTGRYSAYVRDAGNMVIGMELVRNAARATLDRGIPVFVADSEASFPFADDAFDSAQCIEVIEHLMDPVATLREIHRVLKPGGSLFISTPNAAWWAHRASLLLGIPSFGHSPAYPVEVNMHIRHFTTGTLTAFLNRVGFRVVRRQGTYTGFPGALSEYAPPPLAACLRGLNIATRGLGFLAKRGIWLSMTSAGLVFQAVKTTNRP